MTAPAPTTPVRRQPSMPRAVRASPGRTKGSGNVEEMSTGNVGRWLKEQDLGDYRSAFDNAEIDGRALVVLKHWSKNDIAGYVFKLLSN